LTFGGRSLKLQRDQRPLHPNEGENMSEHHQIVSDASGEPQAEDSVGVRVRIRLSGCPSRQWSQALRSNVTKELVGHTSVGHIRLNGIVQGDEIVLEGVEASEAPTLAGSLHRAVEATNNADIREDNPPRNMAQADADAVADQITFDDDPS
jgi:hypothetical protein